MAIDKISDILSRPISQEKVREATSGKKEKLQNISNEAAHSTLESKAVFSEDAKKLQETEVILQNALLKLQEMDEVNHENLIGIQEKIDSDFYHDEQVLEKIIYDIFPEQQLRNSVEKRIKAEKYVTALNELDTQELDTDRIEQIKEKIASGYYDSDEVIDSIADSLSQLVIE